MKIQLKNTVETIELIKAMASANGEVATKAREAFAAKMGPVIQQVLNLMGTANLVYKDWEYNEDDDASFPLDLFYGTGVDNVTVWQQNIAGGLGSALVTGLQELKISTYTLDSAVSVWEKAVKRGRLPYVSLAMNRMAQELLAKQERNGWIVILKALGEALTGTNKHVVTAGTANVLGLNDFNKLLTRNARINVAFNGGTPEARFSNGPTDMFFSPEMMEQIRGFAYQPMNTRAGSLTTSGATSLALPDSIRQEVFRNAGATEIYGVTLHQMIEFGVSQAYNTLFANQITGTINGPGGSAFATGTDEVAVAVDLTREAVIRPVATNSETGGQVKVQVDDQFTKRSGKLGWFSKVEEGRVVLDSRVLTGIAV